MEFDCLICVEFASCGVIDRIARENRTQLAISMIKEMKPVKCPNWLKSEASTEAAFKGIRAEAKELLNLKYHTAKEAGKRVKFKNTEPIMKKKPEPKPTKPETKPTKPKAGNKPKKPC